jgi:hypothetical protein
MPERVEMDFSFSVVLKFVGYSVSLLAKGSCEVSGAASEKLVDLRNRNKAMC